MPTVRRNESKGRYEAYLTVDGEERLAGFLVYTLSDHLIVFTHTEVDGAFGGRGVGSALAQAALDDVRADGTRRVIAACPFVRTWVIKHPEYADLMHEQARHD